jgi:hypothetical protein
LEQEEKTIEAMSKILIIPAVLKILFFIVIGIYTTKNNCFVVCLPAPPLLQLISVYHTVL